MPIGKEQCCQVPGQSMKRRSATTALCFGRAGGAALASMGSSFRGCVAHRLRGAPSPGRAGRVVGDGPQGLRGRGTSKRGAPALAVRMRTTSSRELTKILPSPMRPVWAVRAMASTTLSTISSTQAISSLILGRKSTTYFGSAVELGVALLAPEALDLGDGHALDPHALEGLFDLVELEGLDDRFDLAHGCFPLRRSPVPRRERPAQFPCPARAAAQRAKPSNL